MHIAPLMAQAVNRKAARVPLGSLVGSLRAFRFWKSFQIATSKIPSKKDGVVVGVCQVVTHSDLTSPAVEPRASVVNASAMSVMRLIAVFILPSVKVS